MKGCSRRNFLFASAAVPTLIARGRLFPTPPGLEIYSLRREMERDVPGTLAFIRDLGIREVEVPQLYGLTAAQFRSALDQTGLKATAMVAQHDRLQGDPAKAWDDLQMLGAEWAIFPWIPHTHALKLEDVKRSAGEMNTWAAGAARAGIRFAYHPHGYEFGSGPRGTLFDSLAAETDPDIVYFQMDTFWIAVPGQDCASLLRRYPRRFRLMHLKDLKKGSPTGDLSGTAPDEESVAVGSGALDWRGILSIAKEIGIERYYIEDESPKAAQQIPESLRYLAALSS